MNLKSLSFFLLIAVVSTSVAQDKSSVNNLLSGSGNLHFELGNEWVGASLQIISEEGDVVATQIVRNENIDLSFIATSFQYVVRLQKENLVKEYVYLNTSVALNLDSPEESSNLKKWLTQRRKKFKSC
jgi:hypothetical protein